MISLQIISPPTPRRLPSAEGTALFANDLKFFECAHIEQQARLLDQGQPAQLLCQGRIDWVGAAQMKPARLPATLLQVLKP